MLPNFLELFLDQPKCEISVWKSGVSGDALLSVDFGFLVARTAKCCPILESFMLCYQSIFWIYCVRNRGKCCPIFA